MPDPRPAFEPEAILAALEGHGVRYVLIGGIAAVMRGARVVTEDIDVTPARDDDNLKRLAEALRELDAHIRVDEPSSSPIPLPFDSRLLATVDIWNLTTRFGKLDLVLRPGGFERGFDDLSPGATRERVGETLEVVVASVDQLIVSKEAAGRAKDREAVRSSAVCVPSGGNRNLRASSVKAQPDRCEPRRTRTVPGGLERIFTPGRPSTVARTVAPPLQAAPLSQKLPVSKTGGWGFESLRPCPLVERKTAWCDERALLVLVEHIPR
jgi:hypothetical protein